MKLMTGQLKPSKGSIKVFGEPIWGNPGVFARIGFCPEQDSFYERMTGLEWVTALVRLNGVDDAGEREANPPYARALRGLEVKIRMYEPGTRQVRQATVGTDFVAE
jgi:ABC-2 type transport system ATP-binding protein